MTVESWVWFFMIVSVVSLGVAWIFARGVLAADNGTQAMQEIAGAIKEGAEAFLKRQYTTIYGLSVVLGSFSMCFTASPRAATLRLRPWFRFSRARFVRDSRDSPGCTSRSAPISAPPAPRAPASTARCMALRGGAVTGLFVVALSLLGVGPAFFFFGGLTTSAEGPVSDRGLRLRRVASWRCSPSWAAASTPRPPTSAPTSSARSRPASPRTIPATRP